MQDYFKHFKTNKSWREFSSRDIGYINDEATYIGFGVVLSIGFDEYWWDVINRFGQGFMEAGELPSFTTPIEDDSSRKFFLIATEGVSRGIALLSRIDDLFATDIEEAGGVEFIEIAEAC